ncbi:golgi apparatus membrane protein Tvp38p [[Candida] anglica]|uniref:Golgi apparatus membrane protein TVP38 n=1 Tax=[Candida] anglica TaxID=148631 RepID=A0ABP0EJZ3_9ASCO
MPRLASNSDPFTTTRMPRGNTASSTLKDKLNARIEQLQLLSEQSTEWYQQQSTTRKILLQILVVLGAIGALVVLIFHNLIVKELVKMADVWQHLSHGKLLLFVLVFFVGFPPLLGFSPLSLLCGMVYGFPYGWPLLATASITGSFASFLVYRYFLHNQAVRLVQSHEKFRAFADILKEDTSMILLILLRLCPLPYSLSNGALAAIPELPAWRYLAASVITSPKMLIHVFVGNKLRELGDEEKTTATKVVDVISILITAAASATTTYLIYNKMQQKLDTYHQRQNADDGDYDAMIFGNFDEDTVSNVELDSTDFDADNFVIDDEDEEENEDEQRDTDTTPRNNYEVEEGLPELDSHKVKTNTKGFRDN